MGWNYRALKEILNALEPRKTYAISLGEIRKCNRGNFSPQEAVKAIKRAARNKNAEAQLRGDKVYVRLRPSCSCTA